MDITINMGSYKPCATFCCFRETEYGFALSIRLIDGLLKCIIWLDFPWFISIFYSKILFLFFYPILSIHISSSVTNIVVFRAGWLYTASDVSHCSPVNWHSLPLGLYSHVLFAEEKLEKVLFPSSHLNSKRFSIISRHWESERCYILIQVFLYVDN